MLNKYLPMKGNVSDVGGIVSDTTNRKTARDSNTVISRETFSPESGGSRNPNRAIDDINIQGNIRFRR